MEFFYTLGAIGRLLSREDAARKNYQGGFYVEEVLPGGPADAGGIRKGDVIRSVDGQVVCSEGALQAALRCNAGNGNKKIVWLWRPEAPLDAIRADVEVKACQDPAPTLIAYHAKWYLDAEYNSVFEVDRKISELKRQIADCQALRKKHKSDIRAFQRYLKQVVLR